jgi:hypothetical protein
MDDKERQQKKARIGAVVEGLPQHGTKTTSLEPRSQSSSPDLCIPPDECAFHADVSAAASDEILIQPTLVRVAER